MIRNCWLGINNKQFVPYFFARQYVQILHNLCRIKFCTFLEIRPPRNWDNFLDSLSCWTPWPCAQRRARPATRRPSAALSRAKRLIGGMVCGIQHARVLTRRHSGEPPQGVQAKRGSFLLPVCLRHGRGNSFLRAGAEHVVGYFVVAFCYAQSPPALKKFWGLCCTRFV